MRWQEVERPYEMNEVEGQPGDWVYIGGGRRSTEWRRSPWWPAFLVGGRRMEDRVRRMTADDGGVWLLGLVDGGGCVIAAEWKREGAMGGPSRRRW